MFVKNHTKKLTGKNVKKEKPKEKVTGKTCHGKKLQAQKIHTRVKRNHVKIFKSITNRGK